MQSLRLTGLIIIILINAIFLSDSARAAGPEKASGPPSIKLEKGILSVSLRDAQLKDVLEEISRQGGIKIEMEKPVDHKITMEFKDLPLEKGLKKLLEGADYYMVFSSGTTGRPYAIKKVKVIPHSNGPQAGDSKITKPSPLATNPPNPFIEALQAAKKSGKGRRNLTPEQKKTIIEAFGKGSEENRKRAEELLRRLGQGVQEEK